MLSVISMRLQENINTELSKVRVVVAVVEGGDLKSSIGNYQQMILYMDRILSSWCTFFFFFHT